VLSLERRIALREWAARHRAWVIEDDYDSEFRYGGQPLTPLHSIDNAGRVIYLGTLSKCMFVALRLAYAVVPEEIVEPLANLRTQLDGFTPLTHQRAMSLFMDEGHFSSHLRRMRGIYAAKHSAVIEGLNPLTKLGWRTAATQAGMHLLIVHKNGRYVRKVAAESGLDLTTLGSYRAVRSRDDGLLLRFGGLSISDIERGCKQLVGACAGLYRQLT
jgi:GntR family transcriptional regulator/MocR family aminotransferase